LLGFPEKLPTFAARKGGRKKGEEKREDGLRKLPEFPNFDTLKRQEKK